jgi:hypothetical protein
VTRLLIHRLKLILLLTTLYYIKYKRPAPRPTYEQVKITLKGLDPDVLPVGVDVGALRGVLVGAVGVLVDVSHLLPLQPSLQVHCSESEQSPLIQFSLLHRVNGVAPAPVSKYRHMLIFNSILLLAPR